MTLGPRKDTAHDWGRHFPLVHSMDLHLDHEDELAKYLGPKTSHYYLLEP